MLDCRMSGMIRIISISNLYDKPALLRVARAPRRAATLVEVSGQVRDRVNKVCVRRSIRVYGGSITGLCSVTVTVSPRSEYQRNALPCWTTEQLPGFYRYYLERPEVPGALT